MLQIQYNKDIYKELNKITKDKKGFISGHKCHKSHQVANLLRGWTEMAPALVKRSGHCPSHHYVHAMVCEGIRCK
jgi:hypothetical protein